MSCRWTARQVTTEDVNYLQDLSLSLKQDNFTLVHGSPHQPVWEYLLPLNRARDNFNYFDTASCLVGHSHVPLIFGQDKTGACFEARIHSEMRLSFGNNRLIINPVSVGQARDGDPRASYAICDSSVHISYHYRVNYDIASTQKKMMENGLPLLLISRLNYGL